VLRIRIVAFVFLIVLGGHALGQSVILPTQDDLSRRHLGPTGSPCLTIEGHAKVEIVNKDIYQHLIKISNSCGQAIKVQICYYKSDHCIDVDVPAWGKREAVLGIFPALKQFKFNAKEKF
jgi:hypothetical protein